MEDEYFRQMILASFFQKRPKVIGKDIFEYRFAITTEDDPFVYAWLFQFYGKVLFLWMSVSANLDDPNNLPGLPVVHPLPAQA